MNLIFSLYGYQQRGHAFCPTEFIEFNAEG